MTFRMRLAVYFTLAYEHGPGIISSADLAEATGWNATQVRRDLSTFGWLGKRGVGYDAAKLVDVLYPRVAEREEPLTAEALKVAKNLRAAEFGITFATELIETRTPAYLAGARA